MTPYNRNIGELAEMLTYCRPMESATERLFRERYLLNLPGAYEDTHGNIHVHIGDTRHVLFSSHTDTVHRQHGRQTVHYDAVTDSLQLSRKSKAHGRNCLGADDTVGVWIMRSMILAGVPGCYVFHYGEERGGLGSSALARNHADWLADFSIAVAFDRRGRSDVITHQSYGRCCSTTFAQSLADALNAQGLTYAPDDGGIYTDTAEYVDHIAECTNLSVGYSREHTPSESVDVGHADKLRKACIALDWQALTVEREPGEVDPFEDDKLFRWYDRESTFRDWTQTIGANYYGPSRLVDTLDGLLVTDDDDTHTDDAVYLDHHYGAVQRALRRMK